MNLKKYLTLKNIILCAVIITALTAAVFIGNKDYEYDLDRFTPLSVKLFNPQENIPVTIIADDTVMLVEAGGTVEDALETAGIEIDGDDIVNHDLEAPIDPETEIVINRVTKQRQIYTQKLAYDTQVIEDDSLPLGETIIVSEGASGSSVRAYQHTYIDGELKNTEYVETVYKNNPTPRVIKVGTLEQNLPKNMISELEVPEDFYLDENGVPTEYKEVLTGKGVAYYAEKGARGASGGICKPGMVAVDPKIIPYGTKMYITSTDGKHVYGYAIANDTGGSLLQGKILVDLFMNSYDECVQWGAHQVNIYILE
jgi:3D (Asp-Asp-Asp) domain-containing protein